MENAIQRMKNCTVRNQALSVLEDTTDRYGRQPASRSHSNNGAEPLHRDLLALPSDGAPPTLPAVAPPKAPTMPAVAPPKAPTLPAVAPLIPPAVALPILMPNTVDKELHSLFQKTWTNPDWNGNELPNENKVFK